MDVARAAATILGSYDSQPYFPSSIEFDHAGIMSKLSSGAEASPVTRFGCLRSAAWLFQMFRIRIVLGIVLPIVCLAAVKY